MEPTTEEDLIYGKNRKSRIVSIEQGDGKATIFSELEDGTVEVEEVPSNHWALSSTQLNSGAVRLIGDQHYRFGYQFKTKRDWSEFRGRNKHRDVYSIGNESEQCMVNKGYTYFKDMVHSDPSVLSFDIESTGLNHNKDSKVLLISNTFRKMGKITKRLFAYDDYANCAEMIDDWAKWVREMDPSIVTGHNIVGYDLSYLNYCHSMYSPNPIIIGRLDSPLYLHSYDSKFRIDGSMDLHYKKCRMYGREIIDTMFLSYRHDAVEKKYESYGLKHIINAEGLEKEGRVFYDASTIRFNYTNPVEWTKIKEYAIDDADDSLALYDLMSPPVFYLTQSIPKTFQAITETATGSQINSLLVRSYLQRKHSVAKADDLSDTKVEGGISFAVPGIYDNMLKVDIKSCYPSQILRYKLYDKVKDPEANYFRLVEYFTLKRFEYKRLYKETSDSKFKYLDALSKLFVNSAYGVTNTGGLNYNSIEIAKKITLESRGVIDLALRWATGGGYVQWINKFYDAVEEKEVDRVIMSLPYEQIPAPVTYDFTAGVTDTDSISFCKPDMAPFAKDEISFLIDELNRLSPDKIIWEDDGYFDRCIAIKAKNYVLFDGKKIKVKGSALKGSTKSTKLKVFTKELIDALVFTKNKEDINAVVLEIYERYVKEALYITDIKQWSVRKTLSSTMKGSDRANETKVISALSNSNYREGDRFWTYYRKDDTISLAENFDGDYNKVRIMKNLFDTLTIFDNIIPVKELVLNYSLVKNRKILRERFNDDEII